MKYHIRRAIVGLPLTYLAIKAIGAVMLFLQIVCGEVM